jgi:hypothetical protein
MTQENFRQIWNLILANEMHSFQTINGDDFLYSIGRNAVLIVTDRMYSLSQENFFEALPFFDRNAPEVMPQNIVGRTYIWGIYNGLIEQFQNSDLDSLDSAEIDDYNPIKIKLESGIETILDGFHLDFTYGGVMEGRPEGFNQSILERLDKYTGFGPRRKLYCIPPDPKDVRPTLPLFLCYARLYSWEPSEDPNDHGTELVIQWFEKSIDDRPLPQLIEEAVKEIDWKKEAVGFMF